MTMIYLLVNRCRFCYTVPGDHMRMRKKKNFDKRWAAAAPTYQVTDPASRRGSWQGACGALRVELGCGKGLYLSRQAALSPGTLHIGVERQQSVALQAMELSAREKLTNAAFILGDADNLSEWFAGGEIDRLDLLFCDPWPENRRVKRRLTHRDYLAVYAKLLKPGGLLCFRTDNAALFDFSLKELDATGWAVVSLTRDLHAGGGEPGESMTGFEEKFTAQGLPIYQVKCRATAIH